MNKTNVTECICTLCLCYCTLHVALSIFFHVWTSFNLLCIFYTLLFCASLKDVCESVRGSERLPISNLLLPLTVYIFFSDGIYERLLVLSLTFSRAVTPHLLVKSKIIMCKRYVKDWMTSTHERTLTEWHTVYNNMSIIEWCPYTTKHWQSDIQCTITQTQCTDALCYTLYAKYILNV